jgi:signal transduction histidine kinase
MPRIFASVAPLALIVAGVTFVVTLPDAAGRSQLARVVLELAVACGFLTIGLYVLARGRARWFGLLSVGVACGLFVECWRFSDVPALYTVGLLFGSLWGGLLFHLVVVFPAGRVRGRAERLLVAAGYAFVLVLQPIPFLFWEGPFTSVCDECPANLAVIHGDQDLAEGLMAGFLGVGMFWFAASGVYFTRRLRRARGNQRSLLMPVVVTVYATLVVMVLSTVAEGAGAIGLAQTFNLAYLAAFACVPVAMFTGLLRSRAYRAEAVSALVERLDAPLGPDGLRDALSRALEDPSLEVAYWVPREKRLVDGRGRSVEPISTAGRVWTAIEREGRPIAMIGHDARIDEDGSLVQATGAALSLALERERLAAALRANVEELSASRARLVDASDAERRRLERDLHDGAQPRLVCLLVNLSLARRNSELTGAAALLDDVEHEIRGVLAELRALARGILPPALTDLGLQAAVTELSGRMPFPVDVAVPAERLPTRVEVTAYFIIAEALTNAAKHAAATRVRVRMEVADGRAILEVGDDGAGGASPNGGSGLRGLLDRVGALDGHLTVDSPRGAGTTVRAELPCE